LTFSLKRTQQEEEAKRSVVLPYTEAAAHLQIEEEGSYAGGEDFAANPEDWEDEFDDDPDGDLDL